MVTTYRPLLLTSSLFVATFLGSALSQDPAPAAKESRPASSPSTAVAPKNVEKAKAALARAMDKNKKRDMSADLDIALSMMGMDIKGTGKQMTSKDGRMRMEMNIEMPMGAGIMKQLVVNDGKFIWQAQDNPMMGGQTQIIKSTVDEAKEQSKKSGAGVMGGGSTSGDGETQLAEMQKQFDFDTVEEDLTIDGKAFWAVSGDIKKDALKGMGAGNPMAGMMKRSRVLFTKESDLFSGFEMLNSTGQRVMTMTYKNINIEPKFPEDAFVYTPPAGAKIQTMADLMRGAGGGGDEDEDEEEAAPAKPTSKPAGGK